ADRQQPRAPDEELEEVHHYQAQLQVHRTSPTRSRETRARLDVRQASVLNQCRPWTAVLSELSAPARSAVFGSERNQEICESKTGLQSPSMDFALRANLRLSKFVPDEFVRLSPE